MSVVRDPARPKKLGRYELEECLGVEGGHETYRARVRGLAGFDRIFAVKCLRRRTGPPLSRTDPFVIAAKRLSSAADSRVPRVLDADVVDGVAIAVTEFVHGLDLDRFREWAQVSGELSTGTDDTAVRWQKLVAYIGTEIAGALAAMHALVPPVVHGALSPRNVIATARGGIKLLDFGLAVAALKSGEALPQRALAYAAPASTDPEPSAASDVRVLGAMLFELATGELPPSDVTKETARQMLEPAWPVMADLIANMLAEDPLDRPRASKVAEAMASHWSDMTEASMVTEMASLVRNFSAFVADAPQGGAMTPEPMPARKAAPAAATLLSVPPPPPAPAAPSASRQSGSFLAASDERTRVNEDEGYARAMFKALPPEPPAPKAAESRAKPPAVPSVRATIGPGMNRAAASKSVEPVSAPAVVPKSVEKRLGPGMRNAAPPVTARTLVMSPAPAVPPQVAPPLPRQAASMPPLPSMPPPAPEPEAPELEALLAPELLPEVVAEPSDADQPIALATTPNPPSLAPTMPAMPGPSASLARPPSMVSKLPPLAPPASSPSTRPPLRPTDVVAIPETVAESADWGAQALMALGTQAGIPLSLGSSGGGTGMAPSPLAAPPPDPQLEAPPPNQDPFGPSLAPQDSWVAPQPASQPAGLSPIEAPLAGPAEPEPAELLDDERMENDQTPVFVPLGGGEQDMEEPYGESSVLEPVESGQARPPALEATAFETEEEPAAEPVELRVAESMAASDEMADGPSTSESALDLPSELTEDDADDESWQPPPSRTKKIIVVVAIATGLGAAAAALMLMLSDKNPIQPPPTVRKVVKSKAPAPALPSAKPAATAAAKPTAPAAVAKPTVAERAAGKAPPTAAAAKAAVPEKVASKSPPAAPVAPLAKVVTPKATEKVPSPEAKAPPLAGGRVRVRVTSHPDGAMVWINGEERGKTPLTVDLAPGSARVALVRAGHLTSQSTLQVREGAKIDATLKPVEPPMSGDARFRVECKSEGKLPIIVNGKETGILCPFSKMRVAPGTHRIGLLLPGTGETHLKEVILFAGVRSLVFGD